MLIQVGVILQKKKQTNKKKKTNKKKNKEKNMAFVFVALKSLRSVARFLKEWLEFSVGLVVSSLRA